jgi:hypothetical protein
MSMRGFIWVLVALIGAGILFFNARMQFNSAKNEPVEHHIKDAHIKVVSPQLDKKTINEESIKETQKDSIHEVAVYGVFYKKAEYSLVYTYYKKDFNLESVIQAVIEIFKDKSFEYEILESEEKDRIRLSGNFEINGRRFGTEVLLIKQKLRCWQFLAVYPEETKNKEYALNYVNSVLIDEEIEDVAAVKNK